VHSTSKQLGDGKLLILLGNGAGVPRIRKVKMYPPPRRVKVNFFPLNKKKLDPPAPFMTKLTTGAGDKKRFRLKVEGTYSEVSEISLLQRHFSVPIQVGFFFFFGWKFSCQLFGTKLAFYAK
jgi:hypothetical protein